jgi:AcrR family transcriptional regulator
MMTSVVERLTPERRRQLTRNALVEAATDVFARRGFHAASLEQIADAAGFTRGAIYSNFSSKEDLLLAVVDRYNDVLLEAFSGVLHDHIDDIGGDLSSATSAALWTYQVHRDPGLMLLGLELRLYALRNPDFRSRLAELDRRQVEKAAQFIKDEADGAGLTLAIAAEDLATLGRAACDGLLLYAAVDPDRGPYYDALVERFFELVGSLIQPSSKPAADARAPRRTSTATRRRA